MPANEKKSQGTQPPPAHQQTRNASSRASAESTPPDNTTTTSTFSPLRNSSRESQDTGQSDPKEWFDQSNKNPTATFDSHAMDVDPPFFQKESDSPTEDESYPQRLHVPAKLTAAQSSSADEFRSVVDDLTVEIQNLKDELRLYEQKGPRRLHKDELFEIKVHGLPTRKKRELEATLRNFAAGLNGLPDGASSSRRNKLSPRLSNRNRIYSVIGPKHASSLSVSGSHARPADSAYASMSTGTNSSGTSLSRPTMSSRMDMSERKVESYLRDVPESLFPRHVLITEKEQKKLVVRHLEQLFTGSQRQMVHQPPNLQQSPGPEPSSLQQATVPSPQSLLQQPDIHNEPSREVCILPPEQQTESGKKSQARDNASTPQSGGDQTQCVGNGNSSGGTNTSPTMPPPPEQRPTRFKDLNPDRIQVPLENREYIEHLCLGPPELLNESTEDIHSDADGWVYLNLLCNLAQLHIINITPDIIRAAVSDISTRIQLSPDGRKLRWRGGTEGTKFSSDSSGDGGQNIMEIHAGNSNRDERRKRQKTGPPTSDEVSGSSSKNASKVGPQISASSESFHYKPLFIHQDLSNGQTSMDETLSSFSPVEDSNIDDSRWARSGPATFLKRKRHHVGAVTYYSGALFCTDLSGDPGDTSPTTYMMSSGQSYQDLSGQLVRPLIRRSESGSSLSDRQLSDRKTSIPDASTKIDAGSLASPPDLTTDSANDFSEVELNMEWSDEQQFLEVCTLEPCGLGGVLPKDHFMIVVTTKRAKDVTYPPPRHRFKAEEMTNNVIGRLASMSIPSLGLIVPISSKTAPPVIEIELVSGHIKHLTPVRLPPAICFPASSDSSTDEDCDSWEEPLDESLAGQSCELSRESSSL